MFSHAPAHLGLLLVFTLMTPSAAQDKAIPQETQPALDAVKAYLEKLKGAHAQLIVRDEPVISKVLPEHVFVIARYRIYPVARQLPEGLRPSNVFAVAKKEHHVRLIKNAKELEGFFQASQIPAKDDATAKSALAAWLTLSQEFVQDGFYKFEILTKEFASDTDDGRIQVSGRALVTQGGKGEIATSLVYEQGKLKRANETAKVMAGPRPICQATRLLDRDPISRQMAEQDLLFMGLPARDYLLEQRDQAAPELRQAIDRLWQRIQDSGW
jgi:hypothetical protein